MGDCNRSHDGSIGTVQLSTLLWRFLKDSVSVSILNKPFLLEKRQNIYSDPFPSKAKNSHKFYEDAAYSSWHNANSAVG